MTGESFRRWTIVGIDFHIHPPGLLQSKTKHCTRRANEIIAFSSVHPQRAAMVATTTEQVSISYPSIEYKSQHMLIEVSN
jgi:hypothetical protein